MQQQHMAAATKTHFVLKCVPSCFINSNRGEFDSLCLSGAGSPFFFVLHQCFIHAVGLNCVVAEFLCVPTCEQVGESHDNTPGHVGLMLRLLSVQVGEDFGR